jgi:hypothetical protein
MLTSSYHIKPATITGTGGIAAIEDSVIRPVTALRDSGMVVLTNFSVLIATWQNTFSSRGYIYDARNPSSVEPDLSLPHTSFALEQCYPNPFNPSTTISYRLTAASFVGLRVYDVLGREVATLVNEELAPGNYRTTFDGSGFASGMYCYRLTTMMRSESRRMLLLK